MRSLVMIFLTALVGAWTISPAVAQPDFENLKFAISEAANMEATLTEDGVVRLGWQREEPVEISGMRLKPAAGLGSWAAFKPADEGAIVMGDTVVFEDEITPALDAALASGLRITALHNHFIFDDPPVYFMHIFGVGEPVGLAAGVRNMWDAIKTVREKDPKPQRQFAGKVPKQGDLDADALASVLGTEGTVKNGVVKFSFDRKGQMAGVPIGGSMGLSTWAAFSGSNDLAAVDGDFIMTDDEVQVVLRALRDHDIHVVALHNHMIDETPKFYFIHYWGIGPAKALAKGVQAARDAQIHASSG
jgi:hypothetical protein